MRRWIDAAFGACQIASHVWSIVVVSGWLVAPLDFLPWLLGSASVGAGLAWVVVLVDQAPWSSTKTVDD